MLFKRSTTALRPASRPYKPQTISTVPPIVRLITPTVARVCWGWLCLLLVLCGRHRALAQSGYTITDLGVGNQWYSEAHGLNNGGWAVGEYEPAGALYQHGLLYNGQ